MVDHVTRTFGETADSIRQRSNRQSRKALAQLAWEESGMTMAAIGAWMNLTGAAVSHLISRSRVLEATESNYAAKLETIRGQIRLDAALF